MRPPPPRRIPEPDRDASRSDDGTSKVRGRLGLTRRRWILIAVILLAFGPPSTRVVALWVMSALLCGIVLLLFARLVLWLLRQ